MYRIYSLYFLFLVACPVTAQVDSLLRSAMSQKTDTAKANVYIQIARHYYNNDGDLDSAYAYYDNAAKIFEKHGVPGKFSKALNGKALICREKGLYKEALDFALKALSIAEKNKDTSQITASLNGIAIVNQIQKDYDKAYEYYLQCEAIHQKTRSVSGLASTYNNMGLLFSEKRQPGRSLDYFFKALVLNERENNLRGVATNCENIGLHYLEYQDQPQKALEHFSRSIAIWRGMNDRNSVAITLDYIASALLKQGKYKHAADTAALSLRLAKEARSIYSERQAHEKLYMAFEKQGNVPLAFDHYKQYIRLSDSLKNDDKLREITQMQLTYEFEKRTEVEKLKQKLKQKVLSEQIGKQNTIIYSFSITLFIVLIFSVLIWRSYRINKLARKKIALQKGMLEEQNKNIVDSIKYAKHIQEAILPPPDVMKASLPDHFVLYQPKDIVSGDFYWLKEKNGKIYFAVVDCTGHGVPGAFMSIVGSNGLSLALNHYEDPSASDMLDFLNQHVNATLNQSIESSTIRDGMDISLCVYDPADKTLEYSGANNPIWIINKKRSSWPPEAFPFTTGEYGVEIRPDKQPIGNFIGIISKPFRSFRIQLQENDTVYFLTDGYADQFGGEKGKKFKYKQLQKKLLEMDHLDLQTQCRQLLETFQKWKGRLEQVDDVCVIGVRF